MTGLTVKRSFKDDYGVEIKYYERPAAKLKAIIQIAHGLGEHDIRYDQMAATLNRARFRFYTENHRGYSQAGVR